MRTVTLVLTTLALTGGAAAAQEPLRYLVIHVDPWSNVADYAAQPDADLVLVTHDHPDHFDAAALAQVAGEATTFVMDGRSAAQFQGEAAECYRTIDPAVAVPYHQADSDPQVVADMLADTEIDVRVLELP